MLASSRFHNSYSHSHSYCPSVCPSLPLHLLQIPHLFLSPTFTPNPCPVHFLPTLLCSFPLSLFHSHLVSLSLSLPPLSLSLSFTFFYFLSATSVTILFPSFLTLPPFLVHILSLTHLLSFPFTSSSFVLSPDIILPNSHSVPFFLPVSSGLLLLFSTVLAISQFLDILINCFPTFSYAQRPLENV